jgi:hypothetical protein
MIKIALIDSKLPLSRNLVQNTIKASSFHKNKKIMVKLKLSTEKYV